MHYGVHHVLHLGESVGLVEPAEEGDVGLEIGSEGYERWVSSEEVEEG